MCNFTATYTSPVSIVVVEDETLIRMLLVETLNDAGFAVMEAARADEALEILQAKAPEIGVVVTDIHMPGQMNGLDLAQYASRHWPWISVLMASGKAPPKLQELPPNTHFIPKPYALEQVVTQVQKMVATA
jgi:two-component system, response regulator PdtaR